MTLADGKRARGRARDPDRAALDVEPDRVRSAAAATRWRRRWATNVKCLIALKGRFWRHGRARPGDAQRRSGHADVGRPPTDSRARARRWSRSRAATAADQCREWRPEARIENYLATLEKVYRGIRPSFVKSRFMDWPWRSVVQGVVLLSGAGPGHRAGTDAAPGHRPAALCRRVHELRVHGLHGRRARIGRRGRAPHRRSETASPRPSAA